MTNTVVLKDENGWQSNNGLATEAEHRYMEDPHELLKDQCTDARMWAKSWQATAKRNNIDVGGIDEAWMISWIANIICVAEDKLKIEHREQSELNEAYEGTY